MIKLQRIIWTVCEIRPVKNFQYIVANSLRKSLGKLINESLTPAILD